MLTEKSQSHVDRNGDYSWILEVSLLKNEFDSKDYDDLVKNQFSGIAYICAVQGNDFCFQKITPSLFLAKKKAPFSVRQQS